VLLTALHCHTLYRDGVEDDIAYCPVTRDVHRREAHVGLVCHTGPDVCCHRHIELFFLHSVGVADLVKHLFLLAQARSHQMVSFVPYTPTGGFL